MGEFADYALDDCFDDDEALGDYRSGRMSAPEAYERALIDELGYEFSTHQRGVTCRCCGAVGLHWQRLQDKWRLYDTNGLHNCRANPLKEG